MCDMAENCSQAVTVELNRSSVLLHMWTPFLFVVHCHRRNFQPKIRFVFE